METAFASMIGFAAATLTTVSFIPQVLYCWKTRDTRSISVGMYSCFSTGVFLWLVYGLLISQWPIVIANSITLVLAGSILWLKIRAKKENTVAPNSL